MSVPPPQSPGSRPTLDDLVASNRRICASLFPGEELDEVVLAFKSSRRCHLMVPAGQCADGCSISQDGHTLRWKNGKTYTLTDAQAPAMLLLVAAYRNGKRDVGSAELLEAGDEDSDCTRVRDLFRRSDVWDDGVIGQNRRGFFRLMEPDEIE